MSCTLQRLRIIFAILLILSPVNPARTAAQTNRMAYPAAKRVEHVDTYHGISVPDPYRWLEQTDSDETKTWTRAQDELLLFLIHRKDLKLDGDNPAYMYGYGGMGWVSFTWFQPHRLAWSEMGGVYAQPSLRGGGEYGETWH